MPWWGTCAIALALGVVAMIIELRTGELPNWLTLTTLFFGPVPGLLDKHQMLDHFAGFGLAAIVTFALYRQELLGGGGVKWTCALGMLIGARHAVIMLGVAALCALAMYAFAKVRKRGFYFASSPLLFIGVAASLVKDVLAHLARL